MSDIVERLNDHRKGCEGRQYTCTCGFDTQQTDTISALTAERDALRRQLAEAVEAEREKCAKIADDYDCALVAYPNDEAERYYESGMLDASIGIARRIRARNITKRIKT